MECELSFKQVVHLLTHRIQSTPLYQLLIHALPDKENKTKFKLLYGNVTEDDILLRKELDALKAKYPNNFDVVYVLDQPSPGWTGPSGYISADLIKKYVAPADLKEKVKVFICGICFPWSS